MQLPQISSYVMRATRIRPLSAMLIAAACALLLACGPAAQPHAEAPASEQGEKQAVDPLLIVAEYQALIRQSSRQQPGAAAHAQQLAQLAASAGSQAEHPYCVDAQQLQWDAEGTGHFHCTASIQGLFALGVSPVGTVAAANDEQAEHEDRVTRSRCCVGRAAFQCRLDGGADVYGVPTASWTLIEGTQLCQHDASTGQVSSP